MNAYLQQFIGKAVDVWTVQGQHEAKDSGTLQSVDDQWVTIEQGGELLFFAITRIRLVKLQP